MVHLEKNGFKVQKKVLFGKNFTEFKRKQGVPERLYACHTALVDGYLIEGHVPADLIYRLLKERPPVLGLAVPGMPMGSPGMEGARKDEFDVLLLQPNGAATVELLKVLLRMTSERHGVAAKVIATVDDLDRIAGDDQADVPALKGWRRELFGEKALALKHGRLALAVERNRVVAVDRD